MVRVGFGSDSHRFEQDAEKPLVLGGVKISSSGGMKANSDGDVVLHALFNALSQAAGGESIGCYADPLCKKGTTDSREYLKVALNMVKHRGCRVGNIGIMVEAKKPYVSAEDIDRMKSCISALAGIEKTDVGITFTSGEGLTPFGRGEGILAQAVVTLIAV
ncbi:MAG: 2-C-methyl-D-erythritol 2,4-cyclodiphosphate synthase [Spirochaetota bacterium]